jgi:predicted dinucleotide-binding enzyme
MARLAVEGRRAPIPVMTNDFRYALVDAVHVNVTENKPRAIGRKRQCTAYDGARGPLRDIGLREGESPLQDGGVRRRMSETPGASADQNRVITICGGGNAGHALAVVVSKRVAAHIDWLVSSPGRADLLRRGLSRGGLRSTGVITAEADRLRTISSDPAEVIPNADLVLLAIPAFAHAEVIRRIEMHLGDATPVGCLPTRGGFEFEAARHLPSRGGRRRAIFGLQTLPWSTRVVKPGEVVNIGAAKAEATLASLPADPGRHLVRKLSQMFGTRLVPAASFLSLTLGNQGQFIHPGVMYGHFRSWSGEQYEHESVPLLYAGATDEIGKIVERLSREAIVVARTLSARTKGALRLDRVQSVHDWLRSSYADVTADSSTVAACFRTGPIQARRAPMIELTPGRFIPNFQARYLTEDVPYGLVITRALADIAGVETPMINEVISWAQRVTNKVYLVGERLDGPDIADLPTPQNHGILSLDDLVSWYSPEAAAEVQLVR